MIIMNSEGRFLLGRRSRHKKAGAGYWCPVAGHVERGETQRQAVARECREELGVEARPVKRLGSLVTQEGAYRLYFWLAGIAGGEPRLCNDEHTELKWFSIEEVRRLEPVFPEDIGFMERVLQLRRLPRFR